MATKKDVVRGVDVLVYADDVLIAGQRNCDLTYTADVLDTTSKDDDGFKSSDAGLIEAKVSLENVSYFGQNGSGQVIFDKKFMNHEKVSLKVSVKGKKVITGQALITSASDSGQYSDISSNSYELVFCAKPTTVYAPFIKSVTFSSTSITVKLTEKATAVDADHLDDAIAIEGEGINVSSATLGTGENADTLTIVTSIAPTAGKMLTITGGALKNGDAIQSGDLFMAISAAS